MAFSMFCRNAGSASKNLLVKSRLNNEISSIKNLLANPKQTTPLINVLRDFRASAVCLAGAGGDHTKVWVGERIVSAALIPVMGYGIVYPSQTMDYIMATLVVAHTFWGLEAIAIDYAREEVLGSLLPKLALALVYGICILTLGGLFYLISHDIGIGNTIRSIWAIEAQKNA